MSGGKAKRTDFYLSGNEFLVILPLDVGDAVMTLCSFSIENKFQDLSSKCVGDPGMNFFGDLWSWRVENDNDD